MGCGDSKVGIHPGAPTNASPKKITVAGKEEDTLTLVTRIDSGVEKDRGASAKRMKKGNRQHSWIGSCATVDSDGGSDRGGSATSKDSRHSGDSGFDDNAHIITENSNPDQVQKIESEFTPVEDLDLGISGQACQQRLSAKDRERMDEQRILAALQEEGLICTRPKSLATGGLAFDIVEQGALACGGMPRPPVRLAKLEKRRKKKKKENLTQEEIQQKLERAQERRKAKELEKLQKIASVTNQSAVQNALESFEKIQKEKELETKSKEEIAAENREKKLTELRDKQRAKQEHAEKVRQRKLLTLQDGENTGNDLSQSIEA